MIHMKKENLWLTVCTVHYVENETNCSIPLASWKVIQNTLWLGQGYWVTCLVIMGLYEI